jgi:hypothetical protein
MNCRGTDEKQEIQVQPVWGLSAAIQLGPSREKIMTLVNGQRSERGTPQLLFTTHALCDI